MNNKLPFKWQLFRALNYLYIIADLGILAILADRFTNQSYYSPVEFLSLAIVTTGFLILGSNCGINLFILYKYYPDQLPSKAIIKWTITLLVLSIIFAAFLFFVTTALVIEAIDRGFNDTINIKQMIALPLLSIISLTSLPVFLLQVALRKLIRWNYNAGIDQFLEADNHA